MHLTIEGPHESQDESHTKADVHTFIELKNRFNGTLFHSN